MGRMRVASLLSPCVKRGRTLGKKGERSRMFGLNENRWNIPATSSPKEVIFEVDTNLHGFPPKTTLSLSLRGFEAMISLYECDKPFQTIDARWR